MIGYLKMFIAWPWAGAGWMAIFVTFVALIMVATAIFRKDVPGIIDIKSELKTFVDKQYFWFCLLQQFISVTVFYWCQYFGMSEQAATIVGALAFGPIAHFGNRGLQGWGTAMAFAYLTMFSVYHNLPMLWIGHFILSKFYRRFSPVSFNENLKVWSRG